MVKSIYTKSGLFSEQLTNTGLFHLFSQLFMYLITI